MPTSTTPTTKSMKATSSDSMQLEQMPTKVKETPADFIGRINATKAQASREQNDEPIIQASRDIIHYFYGPECNEPSVIYSGVRVFDEVYSEEEIEKMLDKEQSSVSSLLYPNGV